MLLAASCSGYLPPAGEEGLWGCRSSGRVIYERVQVGTRRLDFYAEEVVLTALSELDDLHLMQVRSYLEVIGLVCGGHGTKFC